MPTVLITGANRGIGLAFCAHYAAAGWRVIATCRNPASAVELGRIEGNVTIHAMDVADRGSIAVVTRHVGAEPIDLLLNNAGISTSGSQSFGDTDEEAWRTLFRVNAIGPMMVTEALVNNVARSERRLVVCMSSHMGSISLAGGGYYQYRSSKAALNMVASTMAQDLAGRRIAVVVFHPGWVRTDMGGSAAPLAAEDSVASMVRVIDGLTLADSGRFLNYDGTDVPW